MKRKSFTLKILRKLGRLILERFELMENHMKSLSATTFNQLLVWGPPLDSHHVVHFYSSPPAPSEHCSLWGDRGMASSETRLSRDEWKKKNELDELVMCPASPPRQCCLSCAAAVGSGIGWLCAPQSAAAAWRVCWTRSAMCWHARAVVLAAVALC